MGIKQKYSDNGIKFNFTVMSVQNSLWHQTRMPTQFKYQLSISTYKIYMILLNYSDGDIYFMNLQIATTDSWYDKWYKIYYFLRKITIL